MLRLGAMTKIHPNPHVAALPAERMARLVTPELSAVDPALAGIAKLHTGWMCGVQFFWSVPAS